MTDSGSGLPPVTFSRYSGISSSDSGVPWARSKTAALAMNISRRQIKVAHNLYHALHIFYRSSGDDAVAEIEDVSRSSVSRDQHLLDALLQQVWLGEQRQRIKISLDSTTVVQFQPCL